MNILQVCWTHSLQYLLPPANEVSGKVIFLHLSFCSGGYPSLLCSRSQGGGSPGPHPGGFPGPHPGRGLQANIWGWVGVCIPACTEADPSIPDMDGYCRGLYSSYWNTFLLWMEHGDGNVTPIVSRKTSNDKQTQNRQQRQGSYLVIDGPPQIVYIGISLYMSYFAYACKTEGKNGISRLISETA